MDKDWGRKLYNTSMHSRKMTTLVFLFAILAALPWGTAHAQATTPQAFVITASGPLTPAMAEYLSRGIATAQRENAELLIFQLDTPGGEVVLMGEMVAIILASQVPVVVYVAPYELGYQVVPGSGQTQYQRRERGGHRIGISPGWSNGQGDVSQ